MCVSLGNIWCTICLDIVYGKRGPYNLLSLSLSLVFMYISHAIYTWIEEEKSLSPTFISFEMFNFIHLKLKILVVIPFLT